MLALHGAFDGASAWALRIEMEESRARDFLVDLTHVVEAYDFAAAVLASWAARWARVKRVRFRPGTPAHARLLAAHGLELADEGAAPMGFPPPWSAAGSGVPA